MILLKKVQLERLSKLIQKHEEMNFLNVRINEIIEMLESITTAAWKTKMQSENAGIGDKIC